MKSVRCDELTQNAVQNDGSAAPAGFSYSGKESDLLSDNPTRRASYDANAQLPGVMQDPLKYKYEFLDHNNRPTGAVLEFGYGTYIKSQEPICFTGDFFPFQSPSCKLYN